MAWTTPAAAGPLDYPNRRYGNDHDRYAWSMLTDRPPLVWPQGAGLALFVVVPLQFFPLNPQGKPLKVPGNMVMPYPDLRHYTLRDYGNRVGIHRLLKALDAASVVPTFAVNTRLFEREPMYVYDFMQNAVPGEEDRARGYWVDIGTIETYHQASMDLVSVSPVLNLYNHRWPIRSEVRSAPPAKFVFADQQSRRIGIATDSMVSEGCVISGGHLEMCILSQNVRLNSFAHVSQCILFEGVSVGRRCRIRRAIIDKGVHIPEGCTIGYDLEEDRKQWFVSDEGIVVVPKGGILSRGRPGTQDLPSAGG